MEATIDEPQPALSVFNTVMMESFPGDSASTSSHLHSEVIYTPVATESGIPDESHCEQVIDEV